jgi:hypothetical protein
MDFRGVVVPVCTIWISMIYLKLICRYYRRYTWLLSYRRLDNINVVGCRACQWTFVAAERLLVTIY